MSITKAYSKMKDDEHPHWQVQQAFLEARRSPFRRYSFRH